MRRRRRVLTCLSILWPESAFWPLHLGFPKEKFVYCFFTWISSPFAELILMT